MLRGGSHALYNDLHQLDNKIFRGHLQEKLESSIFDGKIHGFPENQSIDNMKGKTNQCGDGGFRAI